MSALKEGLSAREVIGLLHEPERPRTTGTSGTRSCGRRSRGRSFVNVARGELSPLADLARLLDEDILGGVGA